MRKILIAASLVALGVNTLGGNALAGNALAAPTATGWTSGGVGDSKHARQGKQLWISIAGDAVKELQQVNAEIPAFQSTGAVGHLGSPIVARIDEQQLSALSRLMHDNHRRCGGYMVHDSFAAAMHAARTSQLTASFEIPALEQGALVTPALAALNQSNIQQTIDTLSNDFTNRFYTTSHGSNASDWLRDHWQQLTADREDVSVAQFSHDAWPQKSVIVTITGTERPDEVVVIGGHLDSTIGSGTGENSRAPGADDDASGIATVTEVLRVLMAREFRPERTIQLMAYAAEEVGLRGSAAIADSYWLDQQNVVGVMQLDMTGYNGSFSDITLINDYTNSNQNTYLTHILDAYLPSLSYTFDPCGYACSDHASWHNAGFVASMPFEAEFGEHNQLIHTPNDTIANIAPDGAHAIKFAKLATAYAIELANANNASAPPPLPEITALVNGEAQTNLSGASGGKVYFKLDVPAGADDLAFAMSGGTGDADLYVRFDGLPSTGTWDCRPYKSGNVESCSLDPAETGSYYVMINGYSAYSGVRLEASFSGGDPENQAPSASFTMQQNGDTIDFTSTSSDSDGSIANWQWDFGDGSSGNGETVSHSFAPGSYTVTLTVTDDEGATDAASQQVVVEAENQAPSASFTMQQNGDTVAFTSTSSDSDGSIANWQWDFGDGSNGSGETVSHSFVPGSYTVILTVTDDDSATDAASQQVVVEAENQAPSASFTMQQNGSTVAFTSTASDSDGSIANWQWDFGDGSNGSGETVSHSFAPGSYTVTLTVTDDDGATDAASQQVVVEAENQAPSASFTMQQNGDTVAFTSTSSDSDGSIANWQWDFGDGSNGTGANVSHSFTPGSYTVTLTVTDDDGATDAASQQVVVEAENQAPSASFTIQQSGDTVAFNSTSSDSDGSIANWQWDFGDGSNGSGETVSHSFAPGTYTVTLTVTDDDGATDAASQQVMSDASNQVPTASFEVSWQDGRGSFVSTSEDNDGSISQWQWDFGDGSSGSGANVQHQYSASGSYSVTLIVTDNDGASASISETFIVDVPDTAVALDIRRAYKSRMGRLRVDLQWQGATSQQVKIYRNGSLLSTVANTGRYRDTERRATGNSYTYKICEVGGSCSNEQTASF